VWDAGRIESESVSGQGPVDGQAEGQAG